MEGTLELLKKNQLKFDQVNFNLNIPVRWILYKLNYNLIVDTSLLSIISYPPVLKATCWKTMNFIYLLLLNRYTNGDGF